jgi:uncharacterized protein YqeY
MTAAQRWRDTLRTELLSARKDRDSTRVSALRSALSAIDNAETPDDDRVDSPRSGAIANAVIGLGAAEVARRELSDEQIRALMRAEINERLAAARAVETTHAERASGLRIEAKVLSDLLGDV